MKTLGVLQVLIGSVPDSYRVFLNIIGMKGDVKTGMANLRTAASKDNPFQNEAVLLRSLLAHLLDPDKDDSAVNTIHKMAQAEPDNLLYTFVAMHLHKKSKQSEQALELYRRRPTGSAYLDFPYLHHMAADLYLYKGDFNRSIRENSLFLQQHKGENYLKATHFKLYMAHWLKQDKQQADYHYNRISYTGKAAVEEDQYAQRYVSQKTIPNRHLLLARLQSDGGYYQEALAALNQLRMTNSQPQALKAEYYYRKARVYHGMEQLAEAKRNYEMTISACENTSLYFAPNAALQLGYIHQEEDNRQLAGTYFRKALSYKGHEYKNSIDAKAKLALLTL